MAGDEKKQDEATATSTTVDVVAVQAASRVGGVEEGDKGARDALTALLSAFPEHQEFAVQCFQEGKDLSASREAHAKVLSDENAALKRQLAAGDNLVGAEALGSKPTDSPAGGVGNGGLLERGKALAKAEGMDVVSAMSQIAREDPSANAVGEAFKHQVLAANGHINR